MINRKLKVESQFHYGSIKTIVKKVYSWDVNVSQFHYGSIKTLANRRNRLHLFLGLNSTMVRLKHYNDD